LWAPVAVLDRLLRNKIVSQILPREIHKWRRADPPSAIPTLTY